MKHIIWVICAIFLLGKCASITSPTGGPQDTIPPKMTASYPKQGSVNYQDDEIRLEFNEYVQINNPREQVISSPLLPKNAKYVVKKNTVVIQLPEPLLKNTTYSINFREAVKDITERNSAERLKLAFSTGPYIDSLSISGNTFDPLTGTPMKDVTVALLPFSDSVDIFKQTPTFFTITDKLGNYTIENLKPGVYQLYAFNDQNKNLRIDSKSEHHGFQPHPIQLTANEKNRNMAVVLLDNRPIKVTGARPYNTYFNIRLSKNIDHYIIEPNEFLSSFGEDQANIQIYRREQEPDSTLVRLSLTDSLSIQKDTSVYVKFTNRQVEPEPFKIKVDETQLQATKGILTAKISFSKPISRLNFDSIYYQVDSITQFNLKPTEVSIDNAKKILTIRQRLDPQLLTPKTNTTNPQNRTNRATRTKSSAPTNALILEKGAVISAEDDRNEPTKNEITPKQTEDFGLLGVQTSNTKPTIIQLTTEQNKVISEIKSAKATFQDVPPGTYRLRVIIDENGNGKWDPGNFYTRQTPERIIFFTTPKGEKNIQLKANFEIDGMFISYE